MTAPKNGILMECFSPLVDRSVQDVVEFASSKEYVDACRETRCSKSKPVTSEVLPRLVLNKDKLKAHCRNGVHPAVRSKLWLDVVSVQDHDSVLMAKTLGEPQDGTVDSTLVHKVLGPLVCDVSTFHVKSGSFSSGVDRILIALGRRLLQDTPPGDGCAPLLPILTRVMLHFMEEWQVFALLHHLMARTAWLDHNHTHTAASHLTLVALAQSHTPSTVEGVCRLKPVAMTSQAFLDKLTRNWYLWPFYHQPFWFIVRVVDLYIVEGPKIFYRLALSALKLFAALSNKLEGVSLVTAVQEVLGNMSHLQRCRWVGDAFKIPHLSWLHLLRKWQAHVLASGGSRSDARVDATDGQGAESDSSQEGEGGGAQVLCGHVTSELLPSPEDWDTLWRWLPEWITSREPQCLYNASVDGYNLRTLYRRCDKEPFILVLKTDRGCVFGSFISSPLQERHGKQFFGTGESFLFTLYPEAQCYQWTSETDFILRANDHELIVGAGGGVFGLWLDSDLNIGSSGRCTAYNNPPLCKVDSKGQFLCVGVEAFSCT